jgi:amidase
MSWLQLMTGRAASTRRRWSTQTGLPTRAGSEGLFSQNLDALVLPTRVAHSVPALGGYPIISVPLGFLPDDWPLKWNSRKELVGY